MSFPAQGFESLYRNNIDNVGIGSKLKRFYKIYSNRCYLQVANFLREMHGTNYRVFNMSGRPYDSTPFEHRVESFDWEDHHSPALHVLFQAC